MWARSRGYVQDQAEEENGYEREDECRDTEELVEDMYEQ